MLTYMACQAAIYVKFVVGGVGAAYDGKFRRTKKD